MYYIHNIIIVYIYIYIYIYIYQLIITYKHLVFMKLNTNLKYSICSNAYIQHTDNKI